MPASNARDRLVEVTQLTDTDIRKITRDASREAERMIRSLEGDERIGSRIRSAQLQLAKANAKMWSDIGDATKIGIANAVDSATDYQVLFDHTIMKAAGIDAAHWRSSMQATARQGINSIISRKENGITLSQRVYRNRALSQGQVDRAINNGLLLGKSAREIATDVRRFISPDAPGGVSYSAMRLARSEIQNAYHTTARNRYKESPWVERVKWNLSGSHPEPDECNEFADHMHRPNWERGEYPVGAVPDKPHPQCLCYIEPVSLDLETFAKNFEAGKYDEHIDQQMGCASVSIAGKGKVSCDLPASLDGAAARKAYRKVRTDMPWASPDAVHYEAARLMGTDIDTFKAAYKGKPSNVVRAATRPVVRASTNATAKATKASRGSLVEPEIPKDPYDLFLGRSGAGNSNPIRAMVNALDRAGRTTYREVDPKKELITGQSFPLSKRYLKRLLDEGIPTEGRKGWYGEADWSGTGESIVTPPEAILLDGNLYLIQGHHRAAATVLQGGKIRVKVYDPADMAKIKRGDIPDIAYDQMPKKIKTPKVHFN